MLVLIIGQNGSGKTFFMVIMALSTNKNILANFNINHPKFKKLEFDDFLNIPHDTDVFIDEAYKWLEKRRSSKASNVYISEIKEQKRKTNSTWYVSEQRFNLLDKRFEEYPDIIVECLARNPMGISTEDFHYKITFVEPYQVVYKTFPYEIAKNYFPYFDTYEIVEPENKQKLEFDIIKNNPKKLFLQVQKLAKLIESKNGNYKLINENSKKKLTHSQMQYICMENDIIKDYEPYLYIYFNERKSKN